MPGSEQRDKLALAFEDHFDAPALDTSVWVPHYLPAWSSSADSAATVAIRDSCLQLSIPLAQGLWCANDHSPPLRVSGIQSGNFSGPVGSTIGQQPFRDGLTVKEQQETFWGWTPDHGYLELRARAVISPRSMVACWLVGLEERPDHSAEICVMEIFGNAIQPGVSAAVGMGLHPFRDPSVVEDFVAVSLPIDCSEFHTYAVDWTAERADFFVDGLAVRTCPGPPTYPVQAMLAVFDFPERSSANDDDAVPELVIDYLRGYEN
jgi:Glycosyl hydrolases family 16